MAGGGSVLGCWCVWSGCVCGGEVCVCVCVKSSLEPKLAWIRVFVSFCFVRFVFVFVYLFVCLFSYLRLKKDVRRYLNFEFFVAERTILKRV